MSPLDTAVVILIVQITIPLLAALVLSMRRNHSASSRSLAWGAIAELLLTPCVFLPTPSWPSSIRAETPVVVDPVIETPSAVAEDPAPSSHAKTGVSVDGIDLLRLVKSLRIKPSQLQSSEASTRDWLTFGVVGLAFLGLLRFAMGCVSLMRTRRRSRSLVDDCLQTVLDELCGKLGCRQRIHLRESSHIGSAATFGWLRPTILVSSEWRTWTTVECQAILAHEIGHVLRRDFLSRFLARLAWAIHSYHPLVRWLIVRLELRQELAADALAVSCVGGRGVYLRCLASLALKADDLTVGIAPTFHSRPKILLRRIAMLQVKDDKRTRSRGWWSVAFVGALSVLALGLHGHSPDAAAAPTTPQAAPAAEQAGFDISLLDLDDAKNAVGLYSVRIGKLLALPGMKMLGDEYAAMLKQATGIELLAQYTEIEQIAGRMMITVQPNKPAPNHQLMMSLSMIRFRHDHEWAKEIEKICGKFKSFKHADETYFEVDVPKPLQAFLGPQRTMTVYPFDARTLLFMESEESIKKVINAKKANAPKAKWHDQWRQVEQGVLTFVWTDVQNRMKGKLDSATLDPKMEAQSKAGLAAVEKVASKTDSMLMGIDLGESLSFKILLNAVKPEDLPIISDRCESIWKILKVVLSEEEKTPPAMILLDLLKQPSLRLEGGSAIIDGESKEAMKALNDMLQKMNSGK